MRPKSFNPIRNLKAFYKAATIGVVLVAFVGLSGFQILSLQREVDEAYRKDRDITDGVVLIHRAMKAAYDALREIVYFETDPASAGKDYEQRFQKRIVELTEIEGQLARQRATKQTNLKTFIDDLKKELGKVNELANVPYESFTKVMAVQRASYLGHELTRITEKMLAEQERMSVKTRKELDAKRDKLRNTVIFEFSFGVSLVVLLVVIFSFDQLIQLNIMMANSNRFARGEELLPQVPGSDEFAQLDETFHSMVASINALTEREKAVFRNTNDLIFVLDGTFRVTFINDASRSMLGIAPENLLQVSVVEWSDTIVKSLEKCVELENFTFEEMLKGAEGQVAEVEISAHWSERDRSFYCVGHDIGSRKELERMKQGFLAMVTHDLRSPIAANQLALEMLLEEPKMGSLSEDGERLIRRILSSDKKLTALINDLLDMEKLNAGQLSLDMELVSFNDLIEESIGLLEPLIKAQKIELKRDDVDTLIYCDSARIVQVVSNIFSNALKVSKPGDTIELRFSETPEESIVSVKDNGPGIPIEFLPMLFEQYTQTGEKSLMKKGSGLGLAISKKLVDLHDGEIVVSTEVGKGTCFEIRLPKRSIL
ncbi:PAS domain-containing protein [Candidatus Obscuribacterales bacterium]|nr:PAS domain-containing protein [Candidatus Obscuribacterales bacterium]